MAEQEIIDLHTWIHDLQGQHAEIIIQPSSSSEKQFNCRNALLMSPGSGVCCGFRDLSAIPTRPQLLICVWTFPRYSRYNAPLCYS